MQRIKTLSIILLVGCGFSFSALAQETATKKDSIPLVTFSAAYQLLRSTHRDFFNGPSVMITRNFGGHFKPSIAIAYATDQQHHDNGLVLSNMKLLPIYANLSYDITTRSKFEPYVEVAAGYTFMKYNQGTDAVPYPIPVDHVTDQGFYAYGGLGLRYAVSKHIAPFVSVGFKGYNNSRNDLDIDPHGITFQGGVRF